VPGLNSAIDRMRGWLESVITPDGEVPLLNDGYQVGGAMLTALRSPTLVPGPLLTLPDTGLIRATAGDWHLLADVGAPCPDELPAHAHADTLSCIVQVDGEPLLVDTGTSTYAPGATRSYERSTAAHNTVEVDGADSTEVWGAFRAARRARVRGVTARSGPDGVTIEAAHDGFTRLGGRPVHRRRWRLAADGLRVDDLVTGSGRHAIAVRWHLALGSTVRPRVGQAAEVTPTGVTPAGVVAATQAGRFDVTIATPCGAFDVTIAAPGQATLTTEIRPMAVGFERRIDAPVLVCHTTGVLPMRVSTALRRASDPSAADEGRVA
jgi:Heparinase II/III-like protein